MAQQHAGLAAPALPAKTRGPAFAGPRQYRRRACLRPRGAPHTRGLQLTPPAAGSGVPAFRQCPLEVLATVEDAEDRDRPRLRVDGVRDHGATPVVGETETRADVFARNAPQWKERQALTGLDHCAGVMLGDRRRPALGDVAIQLFELVGRLGCVDDAVRDQALAGTFFVAFAWAAARRALTAPTTTARDGSALSLS